MCNFLTVSNPIVLFVTASLKNFEYKFFKTIYGSKSRFFRLYLVLRCRYRLWMEKCLKIKLLTKIISVIEEIF